MSEKLQPVFINRETQTKFGFEPWNLIDGQPYNPANEPQTKQQPIEKPTTYPLAGRPEPQP